ncbi:pyrimidine 5'-nucleotidase [Siculibacillus lacustris]|uniref:Pyrimidine 5'-nucleotidase n=2 Tax=Siculibacillus lacustris TaxID=1549641 RepID=A0A4Q9VTJ5_9HYPH|nr:pyrimidine 5'-nucleotidase [Siculibacillus lacustris]
MNVHDPRATELDARGARFARVDTWIFDLDNTLYPAATDLFAQVDAKIRAFVMEALGTTPDEAKRLQKDYYRRYGTTLRGLMLEHGVSPDGFLDFVHDIDHSVIPPDPDLVAAIRALPGRRFVMTNGTRTHAEKVTARIGLSGVFDDIFDIVAADLLPKPNRETYDRFLHGAGIEPTRAAMFEDLSRNLTVPHTLGMRTVLVVPGPDEALGREAWESEGADAPHVEWVTHDLAGFLAEVNPAARQIAPEID